MTQTTGLGAISAIHTVEKPHDYTARVHRLLAGMPRDDFYTFVADVFASIEEATEPAIVDFHTEVTVSEAADCWVCPGRRCTGSSTPGNWSRAA